MPINKKLKSEVRSPKAIIHAITGDGQGKTTASLGLALRALGAGKRVKIIQFMKKGDSSEFKAIKKYKLPIDAETFGIGFYEILGDTHTKLEHKNACERGLMAAHKTIESGRYNVVILDEINVAMGFKLLDVNSVIAILKSAKNMDIVLTGRRAPAKIKNLAHRVSEVRSVKNYFDTGWSAREGIEY